MARGMNVGACSNLSGPTPCTGKYIMYENLGGSQDITEDTVSPYLNLSTTDQDRGHAVEDQRRGALRGNTCDFGRHLHLADRSAVHSADRPHRLWLQSHPARPGQHQEQLPLSVAEHRLEPGGHRYRQGALRRLAHFDSSAAEQFDAGSQCPVRSARGSAQREPAAIRTCCRTCRTTWIWASEWYYAPNSYVSADAFVKEVTNFVVGGTISQQVNGVTLPDGSPAIFSVTSQVNGPSAEVRGIELAWQYTFGDTGFGFQANATFVSTNKPYDPNDLTMSGLRGDWSGQFLQLHTVLRQVRLPGTRRDQSSSMSICRTSVKRRTTRSSASSPPSSMPRRMWTSAPATTSTGTSTSISRR